jgi:hypothetical protein
MPNWRINTSPCRVRQKARDAGSHDRHPHCLVQHSMQVGYFQGAYQGSAGLCQQGPIAVRIEGASDTRRPHCGVKLGDAWLGRADTQANRMLAA